MFAIVVDLPVPGGPCTARLSPFIASTIVLNCEESVSSINIGTLL